MEHIGQVLLTNGLTETSQHLQRRLNDGESERLAVLIGQMAQRYPSQDLSDSMEGYLADFETLSLKYSLPKVQSALAELRVRPGQAFFPRPDEVASELERQADARAAVTARTRTQQLLEELDVAFWQWVDRRLSDEDTAGMTEQQFLDTIRKPGYMGRKAR